MHKNSKREKRKKDIKLQSLFSNWDNSISRLKSGHPGMFHFMEDKYIVPITPQTFTLDYLKHVVNMTWTGRVSKLFDITFNLKHDDCYIINNKDYTMHVDGTISSAQVLSTTSKYLKDSKKWIKVNINDKEFEFKIITSPILIFQKELMNSIEKQVDYYKQDQLIEYFKTLPGSKRLDDMNSVLQQMDYYINNPDNRLKNISKDSRIISKSVRANLLMLESFKIAKYCYDVRRALLDLHIETIKEFGWAQEETDASIINVLNYFDNDFTKEIAKELIIEIESQVDPRVYKALVLKTIDIVTKLQENEVQQ